LIDTVPIQNAEIAKIFNDIANLLEIEGANAFRVRAYRDAARTIDQPVNKILRVLCYSIFKEIHFK